MKTPTTTYATTMLLATVTTLAAALPAQTTSQWAHDAVADFERRSKRAQKQQVTELVDAVAAVHSPYASGVRDAAAAATERLDERARKLRTKRARKKAPKSGDAPAWSLPATTHYVFGPANVTPVPGKRSVVQQRERSVPVELALLGMPTQADRAVAELMARLDTQRSADAFGMFLETWRNGDESFYQALDRTAGGSDGVFYYDAMLSDFVQAFSKGRDPVYKELRKSHDAAHHALHHAFLTYRQYRAFREAVALSLVLPPDVPLPKHLRRYEHVSHGYSLRDMVTMVHASVGFDAFAVVDQIAANAAPLPTPLWSATYDPFEAWDQVFQAATPKMLADCRHTDDFLREAVDARMQQAKQVRAIACEVLGVKPLAASH